MVTLNEWSETKDYGIGLAILGFHCKNRVLIQNLSRKQHPGKLEYELGKIAATQNIQIEPVKKPVKKKEPILQSHSDQIIDQMNLEGGPNGPSRNIIRSGNVISPDSLPPAIRKLWDENRNSYKLIRSLHEKLKLMGKATAADREPLVKQIISYDSLVRANWIKIDAWDPNSPDAELKIPVIDHKRINANRKFICTNLKSIQTAQNEVKAAEIRDKLQSRYNELRANGEDVDPETIVKLQSCGIK